MQAGSIDEARLHNAKKGLCQKKLRFDEQ